MTVRKSAFRLVTVVLAGSLIVAGCARQISPDVHTGRDAGETLQTYEAVIENVRIVEIQESDTLEGNKTGQLLGSVAGGFAGARFGAGLGRALAIAGGAIAGAFAGALVEQEVKRQQAAEYIVRTESGELLTLVQGPDPLLAVGQRVFIQESLRGRGRIIPAT
ncbi:MAG: hypothetical protein AAGD13_07255 [Pseudomonadota bacterium]